MHVKVAAELTKSGVQYTLRHHADMGRPIRSPKDFAAALGYHPDRIAKALFLRTQNRETYAVALCSAAKSVDFAALAARMGVSRLELAGREDLRALTDYPPTGVSPIGLDQIPVFMDKALLMHDTILVGAGVAGSEIEISPNQLRDLVSAEALDLTL